MQQQTQQTQQTHTNPLDGRPGPATPVTVKGLTVGSKTYLQGKGCTLIDAGENATMVTYPQGTTRQKLLGPNKIPGIHYRITFPSGFELREVQIEGIKYRELYLPKQ
jgi:hypothetical protein